MGRLLGFCLLILCGLGLAARAEDAAVVREVEKAFDTAAKEHAVIEPGRYLFVDLPQQIIPGGTHTTSPSSSSRRPPIWSLQENDVAFMKALSRSDAMEELVRTVDNLLSQQDAATAEQYCRTAAWFVSDQRATHRALACEFIAHYPEMAIDIGAIPMLGALLDDKAEAFTQALRDRGNYGYLAMTVAEVARIALRKITCGSFPTQAIFQRWWEMNGDCRNHLWYWAVRYGGTEADKKMLATFDPLQTLKIYLLYSNNGALTAEGSLPWSSKGEALPNDCYFAKPPSVQPDITAISQFVNDHQLQPVLLDLLAGKSDWYEVKGNEASLCKTLVEVLPHCLQRADAATLEAILNSGHSLAASYPELQAGIVEVAVTLDKDRLEEIILAQMKRNPNQPRLSGILLVNTGLKHWDTIRQYYDHDFNTSNQCRLIQDLRIQPKPEIHAKLRELLESDHLDMLLDEQGKPTEEDARRRQRLREFAMAAEWLNHGAVIEPSLLSAATFLGGKITHEEEAAQLKAMPAAREKVIKQLADFYGKIGR